MSLSNRYERYNATEKGKARKRKWVANMTDEQREKQRVAKRDYARRRRLKDKQDKGENND